MVVFMKDLYLGCVFVMQQVISMILLQSMAMVFLRKCLNFGGKRTVFESVIPWLLPSTLSKLFFIQQFVVLYILLPSEKFNFYREREGRTHVWKWA